MAKDLNHKQFLQMWYNRCDIQNKHVKNHMEDIYNGLLSVIQEEVRLNGSIRLKIKQCRKLKKKGSFAVKFKKSSKNNQKYNDKEKLGLSISNYIRNGINNKQPQHFFYNKTRRIAYINNSPNLCIRRLFIIQ